MDSMHSSSGFHQGIDYCTLSDSVFNRTSGTECQVWGRITGVLVGVLLRGT